jgi:hypothetical protein
MENTIERGLRQPLAVCAVLHYWSAHRSRCWNLRAGATVLSTLWLAGRTTPFWRSALIRYFNSPPNLLIIVIFSIRKIFVSDMTNEDAPGWKARSISSGLKIKLSPALLPSRHSFAQNLLMDIKKYTG